VSWIDKKGEKGVKGEDIVGLIWKAFCLTAIFCPGLTLRILEKCYFSYCNDPMNE